MDTDLRPRSTTILIEGMHCPNCELLIERRIRDVPGVVGVLANEEKGHTEISYLGELNLAAVERAITDEGYAVVSAEQRQSRNTRRDYLEIGAVLVVLLGVFLLAKHFGLLPQGFTVSDHTGYGLAFLIGLVASVTSCMAVTGGLLVALAAKLNEVNLATSGAQRLKPHLYFNAGRLISYTLLGGAIGALGSALTLSPETTTVLTIATSLLMVLLGLQMLKLFPGFLKFVPALPKGFTHRMQDIATRNSGKGAFLFGAFTFFLPCGFTQALQLYVLAKGSFTVGALTMLAFALGTLPALLSLSALSSFARGSFQRHFLKIAGVAVILLGFLNIQYGFVQAGSSLVPVKTQTPVTASAQEGKQVVEMRIDGYDYIPNRFVVKQGVPVEWRIDAKEAAGCGRILLSRGFGIQQFLSDTEVNVIRFTPQISGVFSFNCGMGMMTPGSSFTVVPNA